MRVLMLGAMVLAAVMVASCGSDEESVPSLSQPDQVGQELTHRSISLIADKDTSGLQDFLSDAFIIQRATGAFIVKSDYSNNLPDVGPFQISNVQARQDGAALVVRWDLTVEEVIDGQRYSTAPAPRISTFVWKDGRWQLISHANFNVPTSSWQPCPCPPSGQQRVQVGFSLPAKRMRDVAQF